MSSPETVLFPCPRCGTGRGEGGVPCKQCGWDPNAPIAPNPDPREVKTRGMPQPQGNFGFLWARVILGIVACSISWCSIIGGKSWGKSLNLNTQQVQSIASGLLMFGGIFLLMFTSVYSTVLLGLTLALGKKGSSGALQIVALLLFLASAYGLFALIALVVELLFLRR